MINELTPQLFGYAFLGVLTLSFLGWILTMFRGPAIGTLICGAIVSLCTALVAVVLFNEPHDGDVAAGVGWVVAGTVILCISVGSFVKERVS